MSALERWEEHAAPVLSPQVQAVRRLGEWAESAQAAQVIAAELVRTSFVPDAFRGKPAEATAAILAGIEVGLQPMAALRSFDIIQGQAAPRALTLRAIVQSFGHEIVLVESTATRCRMKGRRAGATEWQEVVWTLDRAKALKLTGKPNWQNQPQAMLVARATSEIARLVAADAILGLGYTAEEVADGGPVGYDDVPAETIQEAASTPAAGGRRMSRTRKDEPAALPPADDVQDDDQPHDGPLISPAQSRKLHATFTDAGITERDERLAFAANVVGRKLSSSKDLTAEEASRVIDALGDLIEFTAEPEDGAA